jgi:hypothetical protein
VSLKQYVPLYVAPQVLDAAVAPRLSALQVFAVHELARLYQLHVLNSDMATDTQVVTRDGASWVQRKQPCVALLDLAPQEAGVPEDQQQPEQQQQEEVQLETVAEGGAVSGDQHAGDSEHPAQPPADADAAVGTLEAAAAAAAGLPQTAATAAAAGSSVAADALYVVSPDNLVECCHQVAAEVASYIGLLAEEARLRPLDVGGLTTLLEKLLMVQVGPCCVLIQGMQVAPFPKH